MSEKIAQFRQVLDETHQWPCPYIFKFIVPSENIDQLVGLFPDHDIQQRSSKSGKYISVTVESNMCSSKDVMDVYEMVSVVPGVMSL